MKCVVLSNRTSLSQAILSKYASEYMEIMGYTTLTPAVDFPSDIPVSTYIDICKSMIEISDSIYLVGDWQDDPTCKYLHWYAEFKGKYIHYETTYTVDTKISESLWWYGRMCPSDLFITGERK